MKSRIMKSTVSIVLAISIFFSLAFCFIVNAQAQSGYVTNVGSGFHLKIRKGPGTNFDRVQYNGADTYLCDGDSVTVLDIVDASANDKSGCSQWYKIRFLFKGQTLEGYAASAYIYIIPDTDVTVPDDIPAIYKPYIEQLLKAHPNWKFVIYDTGYDWNSLFSTGSNGQGYPGRSLISYNYPLSYRSTASGNYDWRNDKWIAHDSNQWYQANTQTIAYYMDPRNFLNENTVFMFESLSYDSTTQKIDGVTSILKGSFMEENPSQAQAVLLFHTPKHILMPLFIQKSVLTILLHGPFRRSAKAEAAPQAVHIQVMKVITTIIILVRRKALRLLPTA